MLVWFLPTFLWSGQELDEQDRPFQSFGDKSQLTLNRNEYIPNTKFSSSVKGTTNLNNGPIFNKNLKRTRKYTLSKRIATVIETVRTKSSFSKVYNRLLCPQCIARIGLINGAIVSLSSLILFSICFCTKSSNIE